MSMAEKSVIEIPADYLTYEEAAQALGIQITSLKSAVYTGKLTPLKIPGTRRKFISRAEIESYHERKGAREFVRAPSPSSTPGASDAAQLAKLNEVITVSSAPTLDALKAGLQTLGQIAVAALLSSGGANADPKRVTG